MDGHSHSVVYGVCLWCPDLPLQATPLFFWIHLTTHLGRTDYSLIISGLHPGCVLGRECNVCVCVCMCVSGNRKHLSATIHAPEQGDPIVTLSWAMKTHLA